MKLIFLIFNLSLLFATFLTFSTRTHSKTRFNTKSKTKTHTNISMKNKLKSIFIIILDRFRNYKWEKIT